MAPLTTLMERGFHPISLLPPPPLPTSIPSHPHPPLAMLPPSLEALLPRPAALHLHHVMSCAGRHDALLRIAGAELTRGRR
jgi:hypothetical protein